MGVDILDVPGLQAGIVDAFVIHTADKIHVFHLERCAVNPAGCLAQPLAVFFGLALQQGDVGGGGQCPAATAVVDVPAGGRVGV